MLSQAAREFMLIQILQTMTMIHQSIILNPELDFTNDLIYGMIN